MDSFYHYSEVKMGIMRSDIYITKHMVISAALVCDSLQRVEDGESEITDAEIDELADEICTELGLLQIENLLTIANRAMERHPCMVMDKSHADAILRAKKRILRKISG